MKSQRRVARLLACALILGLVAGSAQPISAQQAGSPADAAGSATLSVSPAIVDDTVDAGSTFDTQVTLSNVSTNALAIHASVSGLVPDQKVDEAYAAAYDASGWFKLSTPDFLLLPNQQQTETVTISVPKDAEAGGHYATVYFESFSPTPQSDATSTAINPRVGVLNLLVVRGDIKEHAVSSGPIKAQGFQAEAGPTSFQLGVTNDGNVHLLPYGTLTIRNIFGQKVKTLPLPLGTLLPGTTRNYDFTWEHGLRFGVYKAEATVTVGTQQIKLQPESKRFVLFPLVIAVPVIALLLLVGSFLVWRHRRVKRRKIRREQRAAEAAAAAAKAAADDEASEDA